MWGGEGCGLPPVSRCGRAVVWVGEADSGEGIVEVQFGGGGIPWPQERSCEAWKCVEVEGAIGVDAKTAASTSAPVRSASGARRHLGRRYKLPPDL